MIRLRQRCSRFVVLCAALAAPCDAADITGRVLDAQGQPVAGARVIAAENTVARIFYSTPAGAFATSASENDERLGTVGHLSGDARTDARGEFAIHDLRTARYTLLAIDPVRGFATALDVATGAASVDMKLVPPASIEGEFKGFVLDGTKHILVLKPRAPLSNITFSPNVDFLKGGRFRFGPLPDVGGWNVLLTEWVIERAYSSTLLSVPVAAPAGSAAKVVLDFAGGESLSGVVRGAHGEPLASVAVVAHKRAPDGNERGAVTGADGRYTIRGLAQGDWTVEARRWTVRKSVGCGVGPKDVFVSRDVSLPLAAADGGDLQSARALSTPQLGDAAPAFEARTLAGGTLSLADLRGKVVLIDFWATWCGLCRAEFPRLRETYALAGGGKDFEIVGVSIDEDAEAARRVAASLQLVWPQTALGPVETNALAQLFNIASTPSSFLIDRTGRIVGVNLTGDELRKKLAELASSK